MTFIAVCSGKGSPGVSTLCCVLGAVWPSSRDVAIAECDPSGNDIGARFNLSTRVGMTSLVLSARSNDFVAGGLRAHAQSLPGGLTVLVGPCNGRAARALDAALATVDTSAVFGDTDVLFDCGRIVPGSCGQDEILRNADHVVVVCRSDAASLAHARSAVEDVEEMGGRSRCSCVSIGHGPFGAAEMGRFLQVDIVDSVPLDPKAAKIACGVPGKTRSLTRSGLVASTRTILSRLVDDPRCSDNDGRDDSPMARLSAQ